MGYVSAAHVWLAPQHPLPAPDVRLHRVAPGRRGTAIAIAEEYFKNVRWGHDLRFYVALLASVNKRPVPSDLNGWKELRFQEKELIWVPSQEFVEATRGLFNSGSSTYEATAGLGVSRALERVAQLQSDLREAIRRALQHVGPAIRRHVEESIISILSSLLLVAMGAVLLLALSTMVGAALGFVFGAGAGAAPGAAAGFKIGLALMEWLGLAFLIKWVTSSVARIGSAFATFFIQVSEAQGDSNKLEQAALQLAEAIGLTIGVLVEALVMWAAARGVAAAITQLKGTAFARAFDDSHLGSWLQKRVGEFKDGKSKLPGPGGTLRRVQAHELSRELGVTPPTAEALLQVSDAGTIRDLKGELGAESLQFLSVRPRAFRERFFAVLKQVGTDTVARASMKEALRLNEKGTLSNAAMHNAFTSYLAFLKLHGERISGDFLSRFWRASTPSNTEALAELRLAEDLLTGKTIFGSIRRIKGLEESAVPKEQTPEFRIETSSGNRLVECKSIGSPNKPLTENTVKQNLRKANQQLRDQSGRTGEAEALIRLDAREAGNTELDTSLIVEWIRGSSPSVRSGHTTRWVEIFYKNASGRLIHLVIEIKADRIIVQSEQVSRK